jgi:hypothetical protein
MSDDSLISDEARFERQRRNVMVAGSILWALQVARINVASLFPTNAKIGSPRNLELIWGTVILYFMWRLYQVSHDFRAKRRNQFRQCVPTFLTRDLLSTPQIAALKGEIRQHYEGDPNVPDIKTISFRQDRIALKEYASGDLKYELEATVDWSHGSVSTQRHEVVIEEGSPGWWRAALRARWSLGFNTTYFTEYTLPYLIGVTALGLAFYRYWVSQ